MSSKFKNTSGAVWTDLLTPATRWRFDTSGVTPKSVECTLEYLECDMQTYYVVDASLEELECVMSAHQGVVGDIDVNLEELTCDASGDNEIIITGSLECTTEYLEAEWYDFNTFIEAQLERLQCEGWGNMGIDASLEYLSCNMDSMFGASVEATIEYLDLTGTVVSNYVSLAPLISKLGIKMYAGARMTLNTERLDVSITGSQVIHGDIEATLQTLVFEGSVEGAYLAVELESLGFTAQGNSPIVGTLSLNTEYLSCNILATTDTLDNLVAVLRRLQMTASGGQSSSLSGGVLVTLRQLEANITGISGAVGRVDCTLSKLLANLVDLPPGFSVEAALEEIEAELTQEDVNVNAIMQGLTAELTSAYDRLHVKLRELSAEFHGINPGINELEAELPYITGDLRAADRLWPGLPGQQPQDDSCSPYDTLRFEEDE